MSDIKIKAGIIGGAGYTGGELIRLLINHPHVEIRFIHSNSNAGNFIYDVHADLFGDIDLKFTDQLSDTVDVVFLCVGHGDAKKFLEVNTFNAGVRIIDLSQDFRLTNNSRLNDRTFIYGLPELNREVIKKAENIANPGCFASCIQLALLPLASKGLLNGEIHINATTGSTGAGQGLSATSHYSWRNNNISVYKAFGHQHLNEIGQSVTQLQAGFDHPINFIPQRGSFARGILAAMYIDSGMEEEEAISLYTTFYSDHPFTHVSRKNLDLKQVVNTNKCLIHIEKHDNKLFIVSIIDNLLKGASGQAVQNMNIMYGFDEKAGLRLKASSF